MRRDLISMLQELAGNRILVCSFLSWFSAQLIKYIIDGLSHRGWRVRSLFSSGGMPSSHTSAVMALAMGIGFSEGFGTSVFALSAVFSLIVMYDAAGVRLETGKQGIAINSILDWLASEQPGSAVEESNMKERVGHSPSEVLAGAVLGILWIIIFFIL